MLYVHHITKKHPECCSRSEYRVKGNPPISGVYLAFVSNHFCFFVTPPWDSFIGGGDGLVEQHAIILLYIVITLMYVYELHLLQVNRAAWHIYLFIMCIDSSVVPITMEIKHIIIIVWLTLKNPCNSIIYSSCILETGKFWQTHCSPIGWYFVSTNYQPIVE